MTEKFTNKQIAEMREYVKHMDQYNLIALKGQLMKKRTAEGKTTNEIFKEFIILGNENSKYRKILGIDK